MTESVSKSVPQECRKWFLLGLQKPVQVSQSCSKNYVLVRMCQRNFGLLESFGSLFVLSETVSLYPDGSLRKFGDIKRLHFHQTEPKLRLLGFKSETVDLTFTFRSLPPFPPPFLSFFRSKRKPQKLCLNLINLFHYLVITSGEINFGTRSWGQRELSFQKSTAQQLFFKLNP